MDDNIIHFDNAKSKSTKGPTEVPQHQYVLVDIDNEEFTEFGFLIFTAQHIAVMHEKGEGAVPVLVMPLHRNKVAYIDETSTDAEQPAD